MKSKIEIQIISAGGCAKCATAKEKINQYTYSMTNVNVSEVSLVENPELAVKYGVLTTPTIIINEVLVFSHTPDEEEFNAYLEKVRGRKD